MASLDEALPAGPDWVGRELTDIKRAIRELRASRSIGVAGPPGPPGAGAGSYVHAQAVPATTWTVAHNLGMRPNVTVVDSAQTEVVGQVTYLDDNTIQVDFTAAFAGEAYVS